LIILTYRFPDILPPLASTAPSALRISVGHLLLKPVRPFPPSLSCPESRRCACGLNKKRVRFVLGLLRKPLPPSPPKQPKCIEQRGQGSPRSGRIHSFAPPSLLEPRRPRRALPAVRSSPCKTPTPIPAHDAQAPCPQPKCWHALSPRQRNCQPFRSERREQRERTRLYDPALSIAYSRWWRPQGARQRKTGRLEGWKIMYFSPAGWAAEIAHFSPVGNPPPPRPDSTRFATNSHDRNQPPIRQRPRRLSHCPPALSHG
jgi:hypothetical protein